MNRIVSLMLQTNASLPFLTKIAAATTSVRRETPRKTLKRATKFAPTVVKPSILSMNVMLNIHAILDVPAIATAQATPPSIVTPQATLRKETRRKKPLEAQCQHHYNSA
ncbi:hypothetical protein JHK82_050631 [Glycine max]|uniref:Uncharacterized protein n=2 Tax=Glycine subgen. Soja TaxID=1462606 RepID=A0A0R0F9C8_SOYBN|nr:hypothetical protein JHK86_050483 [Glycine max]RZB52339.1 hypothetical protein D0Y65_048698 [Glycine soja]KAG4936423.1 hypothetical protein JHK85_051342 [Glycine max]KAG5091853.1 hypothetical protein JHK82_050631 [Glycine max]KAG5094952.1 hypothetical protein JHK84_050540 [Glycine max]